MREVRIRKNGEKVQTAEENVHLLKVLQGFITLQRLLPLMSIIMLFQKLHCETFPFSDVNFMWHAKRWEGFFKLNATPVCSWVFFFKSSIFAKLDAGL